MTAAVIWMDISAENDALLV